MSKELQARISNVGVSSDDWEVRRFHVVPTNLLVNHISCREPWNRLTECQKQFVHHFARASWSGSRICARQISEESPDILKMLMLLLSSTELLDLKRKCHVGRITPEEWDYFISYAICFLCNTGNYLAFGDSKIVPGICENQLDVIVKVCPLQGERKEKLLDLWARTRIPMYSLLPGERHLGMPPGGVSAYYSKDMTAADVQLVEEWMKQSGLEPWNTRIWRRNIPNDSAELPQYDLRVASSKILPTRTFNYEEKCVIHVLYGDYKEDLEEVVMHLKSALPYVEGDNQREILNCFVEYLETGSIDSHKRSQILWLQQKEPFIEVNIGFVETYRDPHGSRAEFESYVATINKVASKQFAVLAQKAEWLLPLLPWPKDFHREAFQSPDFSCLEIFVYANATIPAGVNLPNYEDVREAHGHKNICLSNVVNAEDYNNQTTFLLDDDVRTLKKSNGGVFLVQLACHEILGHGSGKLFTRSKEGNYNFSFGKVIHPFTGDAVDTCYGPGDTWNSVFGNISSAFEECRAECVGLFFTTIPEVMEAFGHSGQDSDDITYMNWLMMTRTGLLALEFYSESSGQWRQAHMQGRFAILRTLLAASARDGEQNSANGLEHGSDFLVIKPHREKDIRLLMNRDKINTVGLPAIRDLLLKLQVYRSTADEESGREFFTELTTVPKELLQYRRIVLANKRARALLVQPHTKLVEKSDGRSQVIMEEFDATPLGVIKSYLARFTEWITQYGNPEM